MSVGLRLDLRQSQQLVMTPQLQQAIKLLQMSNLELSDFISTEVEKNPLLEMAGEDQPVATPAAEVNGATPDRDSDVQLGAADERVTSDGDHSLTAEVFDSGRENLDESTPGDGPSPFGNGASTGTSKGGADPYGDLPDFEERLVEQPSLREHLLDQLGQHWANEVEALIARHLVDELDDHGYLRTPEDELCARLGVEAEQLEDGIALLQSCDPTGVGARHLGECLALQLDERDDLTDDFAALLANLHLLEKGDIKRLQAACGVDREELSELLSEIRTLNPRPCAEYSDTDAETLVPDILMRRASWGGWHLELNPDSLPSVIMDRTYATELGRTDCDETKSYLTECRSTASWLIKSLDQRARTILTIATEIVRQQERFFEEGISGLKPMNLKMVSEAVGMHESTASRVTSNKYIATERGIFELKFFFTNAVGGGDGDLAAESVRHKIKAMVDAEAPDAVLSDDAIVEMLQSEGIDIARRTVAKYRKNLKILSSVERRRQYAMRLDA